MNEPILVVMAAGMGSRYGGLKQIDPVGSNGEIIIDFSLFDAYNAGFKKVVFIIKKALQADFEEVIGNRISKIMKVEYAYQEVADIPEGFSVPPERTKPWGTGHAILACRDVIDAPFAVINADDYYGARAFEVIYNQLKNTVDNDKYQYSMVGYELEKTLTDHGHVARGVCSVSPEGMLEHITERTRIEKRNDRAEYTEDGDTWAVIPCSSTVSMNLWGFTPSILTELGAGFPAFLTNAIANNPTKGEYFLPTVVDTLIKSGKAEVTVLTSPDNWYGVTYQEDKPVVVNAITQMKENGIYPDNLWEGK